MSAQSTMTDFAEFSLQYKKNNGSSSSLRSLTNSIWNLGSHSNASTGDARSDSRVQGSENLFLRNLIEQIDLYALRAGTSKFIKGRCAVKISTSPSKDTLTWEAGGYTSKNLELQEKSGPLQAIEKALPRSTTSKTYDVNTGGASYAEVNWHTSDSKSNVVVTIVFFEQKI